MITGSQNREPLEESGLHMHKRISRNEVILERDDSPGDYELWYRRDDFSGYVITINDIGYEFVRSVPRTNEDFEKLRENSCGK
jgi:hypothetical protein